MGLGNDWQAVLQDKDKNWFVLERNIKRPLQDVLRFLKSKTVHGVAYEIGVLEKLPHPGYLDTISQSQHIPLLTTRTFSTSPPKKRRHHEADFNAECSINLMPALPPPPVPLPPSTSTLPGVVLPAEFLENPHFAFDGTNLREKDIAPPENCPLQCLLNVVEADEIQIDSSDDDITERPQRNRSQPNLYQSDAIENAERRARMGKDKASSSNVI